MNALLARVLGFAALSVSLASIGCAADTTTEDPDAVGDATEVGEDALTSSAAKTLGVPLAILDSTFYFQPSSQDQSGLGVVLGEGVAFATGSGSQSLPSMTSLDRKPYAKMHSGGVAVTGDLDETFGAFFDYTNLRGKNVRLSDGSIAASLNNDLLSGHGGRPWNWAATASCGWKRCTATA